MENTTGRSTKKQDQTGWFARNRIWLVVILLFALSNSGIFFYQRIQNQRQAEKFAEILVEKGEKGSDLVSIKHLEAVQILMKTLVWGVRGEMIRGNKELIDRFLINLVQETLLDLVIIEDPNHIIYLSTDKKYENQAVAQILPAVPISIDAPRVLKSEPDEVVAAAPIMGDEEQIGALFLVYKTDRATEKLVEDIAANPFAEKDETTD
ncbi:MAG: hypothetical protein AAGN35_09305 [Bacteroidota bacterium]